MEIDIQSDLKRLRKDLSKLQQKQIPFATAQAINKTLVDSQNSLKSQVVKKLSNPTPATVKSFRLKFARKNNLNGMVFILPWASAYLKYTIDGGLRTSAGLGTGVPINQRVNKYGNIPTRRKGLVKKKSQFIATINGVAGVWEKYGRGKRQIKLMTVFKKQVRYRKRFDFYKIVHGVFNSKLDKALDVELKKALATAR